MRIAMQQLRKLIKEAATGKTLFITRGDYGYMELEDDEGNEYSMGKIVAELLDAGASEEIFDAHDPEFALEQLQAKRADPGPAGPMERWDIDVFDTYYDVDNERAVKVWAVMKGFKIQEAEGEEGLGDDGDWRQ